MTKRENNNSDPAIRPRSNCVSAETVGAISRRLFLSRGMAAAGSMIFTCGLNVNSLAARAAGASTLDLAALKRDFAFKGQVLSAADADFNKVAFGGLWNKLQPTRHPQLIATVTDDDDVVAAIKFARANKLKVTVRGGGHNWCAPSLRNSGVMIDLTNLNKVISIDEAAKKAVLEPIISNRQVQASLNPRDLAFPSGHCPPVKISGYLLGGGMAWNQGVWGPGVGSVEAVEMVLPSGEKVTASADQNQELFWAARGAGSGFFAVATKFHLKLYPLPKAITASVYFYPYESIVEVADWLGPLASKMPSSVELSIFVVAAPPELADKCEGSNGLVALVTATMFADTPEEAKKTLSLLDSCPILDKCLKKSVAEPTNFEALFDASGALWPGDLRCKVDAIFSNAPAADMFKIVKDFLPTMPSKKTVYMFALFTGKDVPAPLPDAAFSMSAKLYGGPWTMWDKAEDDAANIKWHAQLVDIMKPHIYGHYVSESDTTGHPEYVKDCYKPEKLARLKELRKKYDPDGLFFDYTDGLS